MPKYRFTTTDNQTHESTADPEAIMKAHPGATITHEVETDEVTGESTLVPYGSDTGAAGQTANAAAQGTAADDQTAQPTQESGSTR